MNMNENDVQCPSCGEWFTISVVAPEDYGSQIDYDCEGMLTPDDAVGR